MARIRLPWETMMLLPPLISLIIFPQQTGYNYLLFFIIATAHLISILNAKHRTFFIIVQLVAIALWGAFLNPWELSFGFYPALVIGKYSSFRKITGMTVLMAVLFAGSAGFYFLRESNPLYLGWYSILLILFLLPYMVRMIRKSHEMKLGLQYANDEISRLIKNEERQRIARDLHDTLGHTLSLLTLKGELVERLIPQNPDQASKEAREIQNISRSVLLQVRELISDMQSIDLGEECQQAAQICESAGISFKVERNDELSGAPPIIRNILSLCLRECVTNVVKHSGAHRCTIRLEEEPGRYILQVEDDGVGIAKENHDQFHSGLLGMKERLLLIEGKLEMTTGETKGTKITIIVPKVKKPTITKEGIQ
ncbi:sensor histidine kinase [Virgibacillus dakarensis]|uniref:histidine kinase n=1 Tax=Lentibacillus populi TaxID=1827502 RepID=A0A9W5X714_9BACI|nr:sensor histidine kinase [Lentibacillus populi]MTW88330.1 sensor histidine kinase [Virgibacillus dakarensis]GGB57322.1 sensor histidine kinase [Lentibacillus populi]